MSSVVLVSVECLCRVVWFIFGLSFICSRQIIGGAVISQCMSIFLLTSRHVFQEAATWGEPPKLLRNLPAHPFQAAVIILSLRSEIVEKVSCLLTRSRVSVREICSQKSVSDYCVKMPDKYFSGGNHFCCTCISHLAVERKRVKFIVVYFRIPPPPSPVIIR